MEPPAGGRALPVPSANGVRPLGPDSLVWKLGGDWTVLLGGGRALVLQVSHPTVAAGVAQFSDFRVNPWKRLVGTLDLYLSVVFGGEDRAHQAGADLRARHRRIKGVDHTGRRYHALQPDAFAWVHATLVDTAVEMIERFRGPMSAEQRERYYAEMGMVGQLYGVRPQDLPSDWIGFRAYVDQMVRDQLEDSDTVREVIASIFRPSRPPVLPVPDGVWRVASWPGVALARLVTVGSLPPILRERLGLAWTDRQQRALQASQAVIGRVIPALPMRVRLMPPAYHGQRRARLRDDAGPSAHSGAEQEPDRHRC